MDEIRKTANLVKKGSIEQTATLRAWSEKNNLNIDKFRQQVEQEIEAENGENEDKWY